MIRSRGLPKFDCTSAPSVNPPNSIGRTRLAVPMPPFQPKHSVPVPAPTVPSATGPVEADSIAAKTCSARTCRAGQEVHAPAVRAQRHDGQPGHHCNLQSKEDSGHAQGRQRSRHRHPAAGRWHCLPPLVACPFGRPSRGLPSAKTWPASPLGIALSLFSFR